ncbi:YqaA family protein [Elioraea thermophila]|uniref:YqaA family protein n=1 Tax=Elioraea thermophila TaxID=2185104 RepID=UPI000DF13FE1|nr:YqaA family protein [Elioraea thermophila]
MELPGLRRLYDAVLRLAAHPQARVWLFLVAFAESSVFPIPPDVILAPMAVARPDRWLSSALTCTAGSTLGGVAGYLIGWGLYEALAVPIIELYRLHEADARFRELYLAYDWLVVAIAGFTPIPYKLATIASGAVGMGLLPFIVASAASRGARFVMVALIAAKFGPPVLAVVEKRLTLFTLVFLALLAGGFVLVRWL